MVKPPKRFPLVLRGPAASVALLCLLTALYAGDKMSQKAKTESGSSGQATTTPISKNKITLRLHFESGRHTDAVQFEGGMVRLEQDGSVLGITPYLDGDDVKTKVFRVFQLKHPTGATAEGLSELNELLVGKGPV